MVIHAIFNAIGYAGTVAISLSFIVAMLGYAERRPALFLWLNLLGGIALCFPTMLAGTLVTHVLNGFWIVIASSGLVSLYTGGRMGLNFKTLVGVAMISALIVMVLGLPDVIAASADKMMPLSLGMLAMVCFMVGYFTISTQALGSISLFAYLGLSMLGNVVYLPLLIGDENWPMVALQMVCFTSGFAKVAHIVWMKTRASALA